MLSFKTIAMLFVIPITAVWGRLHESEERREETTYTTNQEVPGGVAPFQFDPPTYFGSGCPEHSVEVIIPDFGEDVTTLTVLFSEYIAATHGSLLRDRKSCNMALPIHVAPGLSVGILKVDYRGYAYVPHSFGSSGRFDTEYFFAGQRGPTKSRTFRSGTDDLFTETDSIGAIAWSECGGTTNFRINTSVLASKRSAHDEDVSVALDSKDISHQDGFYFAFQSRHC